MSTKRAYQRVAVKEISVERLVDEATRVGGRRTSVGLDVAKQEIVVVVRWCDKSYERPWSVKNPEEIGCLVSLLVRLRETCDHLTVGLESTGTYGEAVRRAMTIAGLEVHRVSGKSVSDYKEIFDGVPSQHDGKDAAIIAELTAFGKGVSWPFAELSEADQELKHQVQRLGAFQTQRNTWLGRLEGLLALHWPEVSQVLNLGTSTMLQLLAHYGSPAGLAGDVEARRRLREWGRSRLKPATIDALLESARTTRGVPMGVGQSAWLREVAGEALRAVREIQGCEERLQEFAEQHAVLSPLVEAVGAVTLCTLWATVGDPRAYDSSHAFLKGLGLNLKEISSGQRQGAIGITKRGPSLARRALYFWALRAIQRPEVQPWYESFIRGGAKGLKMRGVVAVMRKLGRCLWYVLKHGQTFDWSQVFPGAPPGQQPPRRGSPRRVRRPRGTSPTAVGASR